MIWHADIDRNTEAIGRPCEHGNVYFDCIKTRNFFPACAINHAVMQIFEAILYNPEGRGFDSR